MAQNTKLVIVESPAKAKTIARYLGRGYKVEATCSYALLWLARNRGCEITSPMACPTK